MLISQAAAYADGAVYKCSADFDYYPFEFVEKGKLTGFAIELLDAIADEMSFEIIYDTNKWNVIKAKLENGETDILPCVAYTDERDEIFDFSIPYIIMHGNIFVREGNDSIKEEDDLYGKEIIVVRDDIAQDYAEKMGFSDSLIKVDKYEDGLRLLSSGKHDAYLIQNIVGEQLLKRTGITNVVSVVSFDKDNVVLVNPELTGFTQKFCYAVSEGNEELLSKINEGFAIVIANGTFNELYTKWIAPPTESMTVWDMLVSMSPYIIPAVILFLIGTILFASHQVKQKKHQLDYSNRTLLMMEAHLIHKQKLESIGILASGVAHEINNPVNGIINYSQLIVDSAENKSEDLNLSRNSIKDYAGQIIDESNRVSTIVSNLLNFSRAEKTSFSKADISTIVDGVLSLVSVIIKRGSVDLIIDIPPELPLIECRSQQIQQILINLITNANDALNLRYPEPDEDKKIIIKAAFHKIDGKEGIRITVEDHGSGIPKNVQEHVFGPVLHHQRTLGRNRPRSFDKLLHSGRPRRHAEF